MIQKMAWKLIQVNLFSSFSSQHSRPNSDTSR